MNHRELGGVGAVSEVGYGAWQIGGDWGEVTEEAAVSAVEAARDAGIDFFDTADVYGDGRSERIVGEVLADEIAAGDVTVATKAGRRLAPHEADGYTEANLRRFVDRSRENLGVETLDLVQLHCPPTDVYYRPETFDALATLEDEGRIAGYGVSVERVEEGLKAMEFPGVESVQIIFNPFRQRPAELFLEEAAARDVGVICRVPLASGLLTGALSRDAAFPEDDHRNYNREGDAFDVGETFAGVPFEAGLDAVDALDERLPDDRPLPEFALRWILDHDAVSTVIPGSTTPEHIRANAAASEATLLSDAEREAASEVYDEHVREHVHQRW
ncbi:aryl-alcohol dehydrogenase-like predicted oxidoreductase [Halorubrum trapanicum]|uniref:Aryl-alcohol dehydrogenase-like predicted oxidoreductase n=1 Tax=Halorubrum trapanicum TaxID=29284 RepID=A0A8J7RQ14_9EURY|nr:aldo/keto reductase [Halorubrum trapanicum]MBP1901182.1 aryl-alcohol dehydrogenase-like predicted oxidoreductase [Halorubrum trapanicum]